MLLVLLFAPAEDSGTPHEGSSRECLCISLCRSRSHPSPCPGSYNQPCTVASPGRKPQVVLSVFSPIPAQSPSCPAPLQSPEWSTGTAPCTAKRPLPQKGSPRPRCSSRAEDFDSLERSPSCSCSAQERKQKALSGWQHWFLSKPFSLPFCSRYSSCSPHSHKWNQIPLQTHLWLNAHPTKAVPPCAEALQGRAVSQQPFLSSLQARLCLHAAVWLLFIDGRLCSCEQSVSS